MGRFGRLETMDWGRRSWMWFWSDCVVVRFGLDIDFWLVFLHPVIVMLTKLAFCSNRRKVRSRSSILYRHKEFTFNLDLSRYLVLWVSPIVRYPVFITQNMGCSKRHTKSHTLCRRCGNRAFHRQHKSAWRLYRHQRLCLFYRY